ncbi:acyl carrier protein [Salinarimonas sp. NSM]|uniref:acyl carrier protein n=1 Tax=Salinarimonas sp. NSM TaxID=3458003 RepID=UPI0040365792
MTTPDPRTVFEEELLRIAPDADLAGVDPDHDLREAIDIDSMDLLNLVAALHERLHIDIPETDTARLTTLAGANAYLHARLAERGAHDESA